VVAALGPGIYLLRERAASRVKPGTDRILVAVLPFENLSGDPQQEYMSDGLTEEMATQLSKIQPEKLGVIASASTKHFKREPRLVSEMGRELGAGYVVEGSVLRAGDRVRVTAQLIRVGDQSSLWAEEYDENLRDVLALQARIAEAVVGEIGLRLTPPQHARLHVVRETSPDAQEDYLRGLYELSSSVPGGKERAVQYFNQAIAHDPDNAPAYAALSEAYYIQSPDTQAPLDVMPKAKAAAVKAIELDDTLAEAHSSLAYINLYFDWDWQGAEREFRRALELNPDLPRAHSGYAHYLLAFNRTEEAFQEMQRARKLDPLTEGSHMNVVGMLFDSRRYEEAVEAARQKGDLPMVALALAELGKREEAAAAADRAAEAQPNLVARLVIASAYALAGRRDRARKLLHATEQEARSRYVCPVNVAFAYCALGDKEEALAWLGKAYRDRSD